MGIHFITASLHYLKNEQFEVEDNFVEEIQEKLEANNIKYNEDVQDIALRYEMPSRLLPAMQKFFEEKFICRMLSPIPSNQILIDEKREKFPRFIFIKTGKPDFIEIKISGKSIFIGDKVQLHKETSALANALGLNLAERDNYPGGKQKVAFNLIDLSWSSINSKLPLIVF